MKKRLLSATVLLLICIPLLIVGNFLFDLAVLLISIVALHEFISIKEERKHLPPFIKLISYIIIGLSYLMIKTIRLLEYF